MIFNSIRWRLQAWHGLILTVIVTGFGITAYQLESAHRWRKIDDELQKRSVLVTSLVRPDSPNDGGPRSRPPGVRDFDGNPLGPPPDGEPRGRPPGDGPRSFEPRPQRSLAEFFDDRNESGFYFVVWNSDGQLQLRSTNAPTGLARPVRGAANEWQSARTRGAWREFFRFTLADRCILVGRPIGSELAELRRLAWLLVAAGGAVLALGLAGGWWVGTQSMRPIAEISATAERIATGDLSQRINVANTKNELGQLVGVLNSTFARLEKSFAQQKQFTADASHELRTPIAVLISEAQTALARERGGAEYKETIEANLAAAQQMRRLTESLLALARLDAAPASLRLERFDLAQKARECLDRIRPLAAERHLQLHCELPATECHGDSERLGQVITNLLANAILYNRNGGEVRIATRNENGAAILAVSDTGIGIALEHLPHIFERFYRVDPARTRADGNTGLGLAISKAIVDAHGGKIEVSSQFGAGTTLTIQLPG